MYWMIRKAEAFCFLVFAHPGDIRIYRRQDGRRDIAMTSTNDFLDLSDPRLVRLPNGDCKNHLE